MNKQILEEASNWFVDFRVGDVDGAARERFDEWLRRSPEHIRAYMEIAKTYVELPAMTGRTLDPESLIARARPQGAVEAQVVPLEQASWASRPRRHERHVARISMSRRALAGFVAAACLLASLLTWVLVHDDDVYATQIGERRSITLADGSTIDLNARSKVRIHFTRVGRNIELLQGQALFAVAKDKTRPFVVESGGTQVRAVGTQFDVNHLSGNGTTVTVLEGRVAVLQPAGALAAPATAPSSDTGPPAQPTMVEAGEQVTITDKIMTAPKHANVAAATAWMQRRLVFDGARLGDVVESFNRYNARPLVIEDAALKDFHISGVYSSSDPTSLLRFLREQPGVRIIETNDSIRITR